MAVGIGGGLDVQSLVSQLVAIERAPATRWNQLRLAALAQQTAWGDISSRLSTLRAAAEALDSAAEVGASKATSSDATVLTASSTSATSTMNATVTISRLAAAQQRTSAGLTGPDALVGAGTALVTSASLAGTGASALSADGTATAGRHLVEVVQGSAASTVTASGAPTLSQSLTQVTARSLTITTESGSRTVTLNSSYASDAELASDLAAKLDGVVGVGLDGGRIKLTSLSEGSAATIAVSGDALADLGLSTPTTVAGTDAQIRVDGAGATTSVSLVKAGSTVAIGSGLNVTVGPGGGLRTGSATSVVVRTTDTSTVADVTTALNVTGSPVTAALVNTGDGSTTPYRLVLTAATTGSAVPTFTSTGIALLSEGGTTVTTQGQDAALQLGTLSVTRSSNTVTDLLPGVTLTLVKTGTATVTTGRDQEGLTARTRALVDGVNGLLASIATQTKPGTDGAKGGPLSANGSARGISSRLFAAGQEALPSGTMQALSQLGIQVTRDGRLKFDEAAFARALQTDPDGVTGMLTSFATKLVDVAKQVGGADGVIASGSRTAGLNAQNRQKQIEALDERLKIVERRYTEQYSKLNAALSVLSSQSSRLSAQLAGLY